MYIEDALLEYTGIDSLVRNCIHFILQHTSLALIKCISRSTQVQPWYNNYFVRNVQVQSLYGDSFLRSAQVQVCCTNMFVPTVHKVVFT